MGENKSWLIKFGNIIKTLSFDAKSGDFQH